MRHSRRFDGSPWSVAAARRFTCEALREQAGVEPMELSLVVSELATNAVRHADGTYEVIITLDDGGVTVAVADSNPKLPERRPPDVEGGRGLTIVAALTSDWGAEPVEGDGKLVWGRLSAPGSVAG